jgi:electron transfer flavoprotein alpha subunit
VAASRPLCDLKWLPYSRQVGATGKTVSPKLYLACGISGAQQHIYGMKDSQWIVAVNTDPNAAIFSVADYCVVADVRAFLPILADLYENRNK